MQVICMDGTVLQCQRFEAIDSGVLLFGESRRSQVGEAGEEAEEEEEEEVETRDEAMAFVPIHQLRFVLPEGVQPGAAAQTGAPAPQRQQAPTGAPQGAPPTQSMGAQAPPQQGFGQSSSQPGPGPR